MRAVMSGMPPGVKFTMMRMGRRGKLLVSLAGCAADAGRQSASNAAEIINRTI
ncbi:MAG: hypothetical protein ACXWUS_09670 [Burkholderiales bacterium]